MRETEFWRRIESHLGHPYARVWAEQMVLADLGGRTVVDALEAGVDARTVWRAVWSVLDLPDSER
ncbi:MAG: DUF3046 domain-containing protein [Propioniciclava sp.]